MRIMILSRDWRSYVFLPPGLVHPSIDQDHVQPVVILQDADVLERVPINEDAVAVEPLLDPSELLLAHEELGDPGRRRDDGFHWGETEEVHEVREIPRVGAVRGPGKPVITTWKDGDPSSMHLSEAADSGIELLLVPDFLGFLVGVSECRGIVNLVRALSEWLVLFWRRQKEKNLRVPINQLSPGATTCLVFLASSISIPSSSM
jgi:hypothetical protein